MKGEKKSPAKQQAIIDRSDIFSRMTVAQEKIQPELAPTLKEEKKRLHEMAKALARESGREDNNHEDIDIVEFLLANETYGIEADYILEILPLRGLTPLPCTPPFVLGIVNVRGRIQSVIDLKKFFDLPEKGLPKLNRIIVVRSGEMELCIQVDAIRGMRSIPINEIQTSLPTLTGRRANYLKGITLDQLMVLDAQKILSDKSIIVHEEV